MSLDEEIRERFMSDKETILEAHLDDLDGMFRFHEDGTIELLGEYRGIPPKDRILVYLIARRYQYEGGMAESPALTNDEIYSMFSNKSKSTVRGYLMDVRESGFAKRGDDGNEVIVERLPDAIERIEAATNG